MTHTEIPSLYRKEKERGKRYLPVCRRRRGVRHGGAGLRGQLTAQVGVLAVGGRPSIRRCGVRRVRLGGGVREPCRVLHHPDTINTASVPGRALHRHRLPAHCHQAAQPEPARQRDR